MNCAVVGCVTIDNIRNAYGETRLNQFGGNAAYGAMGMRLWQPGKIHMVARVGADYPRSWLTELEAMEIDTQGVRFVDKPHAMLSGMIYDARGDRREVTFDEDRGSDDAQLISGFPKMTPEQVSSAHEDFAPTAGDIPEACADAEAVMIAARHYDRQMAYLDWFRTRAPKAVIVMDTGLDYMRPEKKHLLPTLFSKADVVIPSWDEVHRLFPEGCTPREAALRLRDLGAPNAVVKLGGEGCLVCDKDGVLTRVPVCSVPRVTDPTGAGDSFCGGFAVGLAQTGDLVQAAAWGAVSASFIISAFGVMGSRQVTARDAHIRKEQLLQKTEVLP